MPSKSRSHSSESLFLIENKKNFFKDSPLSVRMRPQSLEEYVGQRHILGKDKLLSRAIKADRISSLILYGPPGTGKTTLAHCISLQTKAHFESINAVASNVEELRKIIAASQHRRMTVQRKTVLFIDEIHRFNKAQQDVLMPDLEEGTIILIGATVLNPFFSLTGPLLSRSLIFELHPLSKEEIQTILIRALQDEEYGLGKLKISMDQKAAEFLAEICDGDARKALNALEIGCLTTPEDAQGVICFTIEVAQELIQKNRSIMTEMEMRIMIRRPLSLNPCAVPTRTPRCIGWLKCFMPEKILGLLHEEFVFARLKTSGMPIRRL